MHFRLFQIMQIDPEKRSSKLHLSPRIGRESALTDDAANCAFPSYQRRFDRPTIPELNEIGDERRASRKIRVADRISWLMENRARGRRPILQPWP